MQSGPSLKPFERRRAFEEILLQFEAAIHSGQISAGSKLPAERELAESLGVSRTSVREALRVLEGLGLVRVRPGAEHGATLLAEPTNALARLFELHLALRHVSLASVIDFRAIVEASAARAVAQAGDRAVLAALEDVFRQQGDPAIDREHFHDLDTEFHLVLVRGAGNELATLVLEGIRGAVTKMMLEAIGAAGDWQVTHARLVDEHLAILDAIKEGRGDDAAEFTESHIRRFYEQHLRSDVASAPAAL
jgi:DNA-binding FadR family transcriptional regulator